VPSQATREVAGQPLHQVVESACRSAQRCAFGHRLRRIRSSAPLRGARQSRRTSCGYRAATREEAFCSEVTRERGSDSLERRPGPHTSASATRCGFARRRSGLTSHRAEVAATHRQRGDGVCQGSASLQKSPLPTPARRQRYGRFTRLKHRGSDSGLDADERSDGRRPNQSSKVVPGLRAEKPVPSGAPLSLLRLVRQVAANALRESVRQVRTHA
jgi:hypothetical protein